MSAALRGRQAAATDAAWRVTSLPHSPAHAPTAPKRAAESASGGSKRRRAVGGGGGAGGNDAAGAAKASGERGAGTSRAGRQEGARFRHPEGEAGHARDATSTATARGASATQDGESDGAGAGPNGRNGAADACAGPPITTHPLPPSSPRWATGTRLACFSSDFAAVRAWHEWRLGSDGVDGLLRGSDGIVVIPGFLPPLVAEDALKVLRSVPGDAWVATAAAADYGRNNIEHRFESCQPDRVGSVTRLLEAVSPDSLSAFNAAKYTSGDHIEQHDDLALKDFAMEDGTVQRCSRDIALILYLTKGWDRSQGGLLVDHGATGAPVRRVVVPEFNTAVAFRVPRLHEVTAVVGDAPRYSVFGWFYHDAPARYTVPV